ncbi:hypothetical protein TNCV_2435521 [Trichonephila clavipes]|nr:hypothetical protein TNCV_2435521 [Trichonephila clavipes]
MYGRNMARTATRLQYGEIIGVAISIQDLFVARRIYNWNPPSLGPLAAARSAARLIRLCSNHEILCVRSDHVRCSHTGPVHSVHRSPQMAGPG